jgi:hypothetical protein
MDKIILGIFIGVAAVAMCQDRVTASTSRPSAAAPRFDRGVVEGRTYKNASVGIELTPAPELTFGTPELKGMPGTFVTVAAWDQELVSARGGTIFYADALANHPEDQRSTEARVQSVVHDNRNFGFEPLDGSTREKLGGVVFARTDFRKGAAHEAVFIRACDTQALVLVFYGVNREAVNKLVTATELKLDLSMSGCGSRAGSVPKK